MSSVSGSRLITTPAAWVLALRATPSSCLASSTSLPTCGSASTCSRNCGRDRERLVEPDPELVGDRLGDPVDLAVAHPEDPPDVADRGPGEHRAERDDLGDVVLAVLPPDVGDDLLAPAVLEVDVDVGHRHPVGVEEALERELVEDRIDRRDPERVGHDRAGRAAPAGRLDPLLAGEPDEVGDDQEVARVAHRGDHAELVVEALLELRGHRPVAAPRGRAGTPTRASSRRSPRRGPGSAGSGAGRAGSSRPPVISAIRRVFRIASRWSGKRARHLGRRLEVEVGRVELEPARRVEVVARPDAEQDVVGLGLALVHVVEVVRHDERQAGLRRQPDELLVEPALLGEAVVLELEEEPVGAEDVAVLAGEPAGVAPSRRSRGRAGSRRRGRPTAR